MVNELRILGAPAAVPARPAVALAMGAEAIAEPRDAVMLGAPAQTGPVVAATRTKGLGPKSNYVPGQVLVKLDSNAPSRSAERLAERFGLRTLRHFEVPAQMAAKFGGDLYQFKLREGESVQNAIRLISREPGVAYVEPNYRVHLDDPTPAASAPLVAGTSKRPPEVLPNDLDSRLWGIRNTGQDGGKAGVDVGAAQAWATTTGAPNGQGPLVCVIDTGLDYGHPDLAANVWTNPKEIAGDGIDNDGNGIVDDVHGANLAAHNGDPFDDHGHGTHCAGTIGAVGNNGTGVVGVQWNATVASAKFLDANGSGTYADAIQAVMYAASIGARITSNSWGGGAYSQALYDAFKSSPALHICAAGNDGSNTDVSPTYPGAFNLDNVVSVAAIDRTGQLADFSNYGAASVDLAAPGVDVYSTRPGGAYQTLSGTSMATPHVTGVAGLILSKFPDLTNEQIKARLLNTVVKEDELAGKVASGGRVNAANALEDDTVPPADISDLAVAQRGSASMTLSFTATGDDGRAGRASSYQVRWSTQPIVDGDTWNAASVATGLPAPAPSGTVEHIRVAIPPDAGPKTWYFGLKALDNLGNASGLATTSGTSVPAVIAFADDFETDSRSWKATGDWGRVQDGPHGYVYEDSPGTVYPSNAKATLTSVPIDLSQVKNPRLLFSEKHELEDGFDTVEVEVCREGHRWEPLVSITGKSDWSDRSVSLQPYEGQKVRIRFRLTSDASVNLDGISLDNVKIAGDPA